MWRERLVQHLYSHTLNILGSCHVFPLLCVAAVEFSLWWSVIVWDLLLLSTFLTDAAKELSNRKQLLLFGNSCTPVYSILPACFHIEHSLFLSQMFATAVSLQPNHYTSTEYIVYFLCGIQYCTLSKLFSTFWRSCLVAALLYIWSPSCERVGYDH